MPRTTPPLLTFLLALIALAWTTPAVARWEYRGGGRLLLTDGVTALEGSAGGGIATWASIAGAATRDGVGGTVHATLVAAPDFTLRSYGAAAGIFDRVELSYARQDFDTGRTGAALGIGRGFTFGQDIFAAKVRLVGDLLYDQDSILPQISVGVQHKRAAKAPILAAVGARDANGTDVYIAATKLLLGRGLLLNATVRRTRANQGGLLGFGGDAHRGATLQAEGSAAVMLSPRLAVGAEYRTKPDNLGFAREDDWLDLFAAWSVTRNLTVTAAYADLGSIATFDNQRSLFLSLRGRF